MAKIALLIGVSEYKFDLKPLPAAAKDIEAMERVLSNPRIGGFDDIKLLTNPDAQLMREAIEILFSGLKKDDLVLLYFSGHGIRNDYGNLLFATCDTCKNNGEIWTARAVQASFVHHIMNSSRSKRQVLILDCCFSGAFIQEMGAKNNDFVDIKNQLGGEGRAILTSSTSTQYSFEQPGSDISIYTRYIVEGLETGAADKDEDGLISVDELHEYARTKVQEAVPAMKPEIYPIKEGYKIQLAQAPIGDPRLKYRKEVKYYARNREISNAGRDALNVLRDELGLTPEEATAIENEVLEPFRKYKRKLERYKETFHKTIQREYPMSDNACADLRRFQKSLGLTNEDIKPIEDTIIADLQVANPPDSPPGKNIKNHNYPPLIIFIIGILGAVSCFVTGYLYAKYGNPRDLLGCNINITEDLKISVGEKILLEPENTKPDKKAGVDALKKKDCQTAIRKLALYLVREKGKNIPKNPNELGELKKITNDPEALIYLNNAMASRRGNPVRIAVSVPIGSNPNVAKEMLRGVAQAQNEVNSNGGIKGRLLQVVIADDENDPGEATKIAKKFVEDESIMAVVGPNATQASVPAAHIYKDSKLWMITPTSFSNQLTGMSQVLRTVPPVKIIAERLAKHIKKKEIQPNILVCFDDAARDNEDFKNSFIEEIKKVSGQIDSQNCNINNEELDLDEVINEAKKNGANGLLLSPHVDNIEKILNVARANPRANRERLPLYGSLTLYTQETLEGKGDINNMVIAVPWHIEKFPNSSFSKYAKNLWSGRVNWRTATSYDATLAIIEGLKKHNTRRELAKVFKNGDFSFDGAMGNNIRLSKKSKGHLLPSGDIQKTPVTLLQIQQKGNKYDFVPLCTTSINRNQSKLNACY